MNGGNPPKLSCNEKKNAKHHMRRLGHVWMHPVPMASSCQCIHQPFSTWEIFRKIDSPVFFVQTLLNLVMNSFRFESASKFSRTASKISIASQNKAPLAWSLMIAADKNAKLLLMNAKSFFILGLQIAFWASPMHSASSGSHSFKNCRIFSKCVAK